MQIRFSTVMGPLINKGTFIVPNWKPIFDITYLYRGLMHIAGFHFY